ncbi:PD-(D/E)XK nuclease family protein [uncultured Flavobacterium sp.]|jgi:hypothetical protein|uniref:PDDEXK-like family protein n=1 Tax=uncultured Flavobacterium sp. TaxID=165435 RepID=UPI0025913331|nr:PD-(D/E)XK nuclease family protein [uncultured Flavobacterium sp.]
MSEVEQLSISNLLSQVTIIKKKYDDLAEYTGENYNIFKVLGIYQDELSHSAIIGDLLNNKGSHGQKDTFLKLFLNEINNFEENTEQFKVLQNFKSDKSTAYIEKHIGKVDYSNGEGGRIDVLLNDGFNNIIIENKVWASDQKLQLVRYNNQDKNAPIIYLTLDGKEPSIESKGNLILSKDFICLSYNVEIVRWLEKCIKEMANKPFIRESLNQYIVIVKQLTNQSNNSYMNEIIGSILKNENNFQSAKLILKSLNSIENNLVKKLDDLVKVGEVEKSNINIIFNDHPVIKKLNIVKRFSYNGITMIRFDLVTIDEENNYQVIAIQPEIRDYKIYNKLWANNKKIEAKLIEKTKENIDFFYDYEDSVDDMFKIIFCQIKLITELLENGEI